MHNHFLEHAILYIYNKNNYRQWEVINWHLHYKCYIITVPCYCNSLVYLNIYFIIFFFCGSAEESRSISSSRRVSRQISGRVSRPSPQRIRNGKLKKINQFLLSQVLFCLFFHPAFWPFINLIVWSSSDLIGDTDPRWDVRQIRWLLDVVFVSYFFQFWGLILKNLW